LPRARFFCEATPGDTLTYTTVIESFSPEGAKVAATSHLGETLHAEAEIVFAHLNHPETGALFDPGTFLHMMRLLGAFRVGRAADGGPLRPPPGLLAAETDFLDPSPSRS
jgi:3-hydroxyacyl-[acyl-carrier-protein] dehydratase